MRQDRATQQSARRSFMATSIVRTRRLPQNKIVSATALR